MRKLTTGSNRIYKTEFGKELDLNFNKFCKIYYSVYQLYFLYKSDLKLFESKYGNKSFHMVVKNKFNLNDYYTNTLVQKVKGVYDSQVECLNNTKQILEEHKHLVEQKLEKEYKLLNKYLELKNNLNNYYQDYLIDNEIKFKSNLKHIKIKSLEVTVTNKNNIRHFKLLEFEYKYLNPKIRFIKNKISKLKYRINNYDNRINNLKIKRIVFYKKYLGTKDFKDKKYSSFEVSGRLDSKYKNFIFKMSPNGDINIKLINNNIINLKLEFKYQGDLIKYILENNIKTPLYYKLVKRKDGSDKYYYQVFVTLDYSINKRLNTDISTGMIGIDFNYGHIDYTETDSTGNLIYKNALYYNTSSTSDERTQSLNKVLNEVFMYAESVHKCIAVEKLNTSKSKSKSTYRNKKINNIFSNFAYNKYLDECEYLKYKYLLDVIKVSPYNTSKIAKSKYNYKKLNDHVAASYVIARRGQGYKDRYIK